MPVTHIFKILVSTYLIEAHCYLPLMTNSTKLDKQRTQTTQMKNVLYTVTRLTQQQRVTRPVREII